MPQLKTVIDSGQKPALLRRAEQHAASFPGLWQTELINCAQTSCCAALDIERDNAEFFSRYHQRPEHNLAGQASDKGPIMKLAAIAEDAADKPQGKGPLYRLQQVRIFL